MKYFRIKPGAVPRILKRPAVASAVKAHAEGVAAEIHRTHPDIEPTVHTYTTDRAAASVTVANGKALQAKDGVFTKAAAARGLEVSS